MVDDRLEERLRIALRVTGEDLDLSVTTAELERRLRLRRRSRTVQRSVLIAAVVAVLAIGVAASGTWFRGHTNVGATPSPVPDASLTLPSPSLPGVVPPSAEATIPKPSPDGTRVPLTVRYWMEDGRAYEVGADGNGRHRVPTLDRDMNLPTPTHDVPKSWDGRFSAGERGGVDGIFATNGRLVMEVPSADRGPIVASTWSPTANLVVVVRAERTDHFAPGSAWVLDADDERVLAGPLDVGRERDWAWSPDGRAVAISAVDGLRIVDGASATVATYRSTIIGVSGYVGLDWSPDGRWILFLPWYPGKNEVDRVAADGTHGKRLSLGWSPAWSPDSSRIVFLHSAKADSIEDSWQIWTMDADGSDRKPLVQAGCPCAAPEWSPDGSLILLQEGNDLWVMAADGSRAKRLAQDAFGTWVRP